MYRSLSNHWIIFLATLWAFAYVESYSGAARLA